MKDLRSASPTGPRSEDVSEFEFSSLIKIYCEAHKHRAAYATITDRMLLRIPSLKDEADIALRR